jgi:hypothetical protein
VVLAALLAAPAAARAAGPVPYDISRCFPGEIAGEIATICVEDHGTLKLAPTPTGTLVAVAAGTLCVDVFVDGGLVTSYCEDYRSVNVATDADENQVLRFRRVGTQTTIDPGTGEPALSCTYTFNVVIAGGEPRHEDIAVACE